MAAVPSNDDRRPLARAKVNEYGVYLEYAQEQVNDPDLPFRAAVRHALRASETTLIARSSRDWAQVARDWAQAAELMQLVETNSAHYDVARDRSQRYQTYRDYAQQQVIANVRR
ncbi:MAG: hypothetical protein HC838_10255 [Spirulinaceae cyanobacterium RM2_2_10]|nr:hypothetical protein [Spirulinaceae cyanobacterium RM2_2_10]